MAHILLLNGPNLNLLGLREPGIYGQVTLDQVHERLTQQAADLGHRLTAFQSNSEAELIERIHQAPASHVGFVVFNPAAFTHTSVALRDALLGSRFPSSKCTSATCTRGRTSVITRISPTSPSASSPVS